MHESLTARVTGRGTSPGGYAVILIEPPADGALTGRPAPTGVLNAYPGFPVEAHIGHLVSFTREVDHLNPQAGRTALCLDCSAAASAAYEARSLEAW